MTGVNPIYGFSAAAAGSSPLELSDNFGGGIILQNVWRLTQKGDGGGSGASSAIWGNTLLNITQDFSITAYLYLGNTVVDNNQTYPGADGMAFVLIPGRGQPTYGHLVGAPGQQIGYGGSTSNGFNLGGKGIAVEFDTYNNSEYTYNDGTVSGAEGSNHFAIVEDLDPNHSSGHTLGLVRLSETPTDGYFLKDSKWHQVVYTYTAATTQLNVKIYNNSGATGDFKEITVNKDLFAYLGTTYASWGFTAGQMGGTNVHAVALGPITAVLPVTWSYFNVKPNGSSALLNWGTETESNTKSFDIERGTDGQSFTKIGTVAAAGNSTSLKEYSFTDPSLSNGIYYYRLNQVDLDGKSAYSAVKKITIDGISSVTAKAYPNPARDYVVVTASATSQIALFDISGKSYPVSAVIYDNTSKKISTQSLPSGNYIIRVVENGGTVQNYKIAVIH